MKHHKISTIPLLLALLSVPLSMSNVAAQSNSAAAPVEVLRLPVQKPLLAAQELYKEKKYPEALAYFTELDAIADKTSYERFMIDSVRATIAQASGDNPLTIKSFEALLASGRMNPGDQLKLVQQLGVRYYQTKNYAQAAANLSRFLKEAGDDRKMRILMVQARYLNAEYPIVVTELRSLVNAEEKDGKKPDLDLLQLWGSAVQLSTDKSGYVEVLEKFVIYYPKKEYWVDLLHRVELQVGFNDRLLLDLLRLQYATKSMSSASDYVELAQTALAAGFPTEAKKVLDEAYSTDVMAAGTPADIKVRQKLRDSANKSAADDLKTLASGEAGADKPGKDGNGLTNIGFALVQIGQFDKGLSLIERGIAKGLGKRGEDGKLHLGIAQAMAGKKDEALKTLASVGGTDGTAEIARYWALYLNQK
jgi:Tfp pilus assembly protein PilF